MPRLSLVRIICFAAVLSSSARAVGAPQTQYTIINLGVLGSAPGAYSSGANAINNSGQIVGASSTSTGKQHAFLWEKGVMKDLGSLLANGQSSASAINDFGVVVGQSDAPGNSGRAFYYVDGKMVDMGAPAGADFSAANGINNSGQIVGNFGPETQSQTSHTQAFLYSNQAFEPLGDFNGPTDSTEFSNATAINQSGVVVGTGAYGKYGTDQSLAAIDTGSGLMALPQLPANQVGFDDSATAYAINASGQIVGISSNNVSLPSAVIWSDGTVQALGNLATGYPSYASGINDAGQIVGAANIFSGDLHAVIVNPGGTMTDLNTLVPSGKMANFTYLVQANQINNNGWIVGLGALKSGNQTAFLAIPSAPMGTPVAAEDQAAPGLANLGSPVFSAAGPPAIDSGGDVAFRAAIKAPPKAPSIPASENSGIWLYQGSVGTLIAQTGALVDPTDPAGPVFTQLGDPVLSSVGDLAFVGSFGGGKLNAKPSTGIFVKPSGASTALTLAEQIGSPAPTPMSADAEYTAFEEVAIEDGGGLAFLAAIKGKGLTDANNLGVWASDGSGALGLVAQKNEGLPGVTPIVPVLGLTAFKPLGEVSGQSRSLDPIGGNLAFLAQARTPPQSVVAAAALTHGFSVNNLDSKLPVTVKSPGEPIINKNATVALLAALGGSGITSANDSGIVLITAAGGSLVVQTGGPAPDAEGAITAGAVFSKLSDPVLNNSDCYAFIGSLAPGAGDTFKSGSNASGIWTNFGGVLKRVVRKGDPAPGTLGAFATFEQLVLPDVGGVIFTASLSGVPSAQAQSLWAVGSTGALELIVEAGNSLSVPTAIPPTKTVKSIGVFPLPAGAFGQSRSFDAPSQNLVYQATFSDDSWGIFEVLAPY